MHIDESLNTYHDSVYLDKMHDPDAVRKRWYSPRELQNFVDRVVHRVERFCEDNEKSSSPRMAAIRAIEHAYRFVVRWPSKIHAARMNLPTLKKTDS